jgi:dihydrolipoamide dehydrogenase
LTRGLEALVRTRGVELIAGRAVVRDVGTVEVTGSGGTVVVGARAICVATGSVPVDLPNLPRDGRFVVGSDDVLRTADVPRVGLVVGGGPVGVEFASMWRSFGSTVHLVEAADRLLPREDPESSAALAEAFERRGITVYTGQTVTAARVHDERVRVLLSGGAAIEVDRVLVAVGRQPAAGHVGLDDFGVLGANGAVVVDAVGRTAVEGLWAVGDVVGRLPLAHTAFAEGFAVADALAGIEPSPVPYNLIPRVTYSVPEVASVGLTEPEARAAGLDAKVTVVGLAGNARAAIEGVDGRVKLVRATDGTLLGAHVVGPGATELIAELGLAVAWQALDCELADVVHPHPSLAESVREAALAAAGRPFHVRAAGGGPPRRTADGRLSR